ncbi:hypothetical protein EG68_05076 [Paragonimus skrjabini miyazakii]|uniref:Uncharacterized protein n=1 Tax=Paragonimus skrjabini miyazakii TaxID=59628 RepID=A0A8S9YTD4_9TREM|nr:hypothetical protein EG68_05076 [Paragonimus skrjabini miyazakii]
MFSIVMKTAILSFLYFLVTLDRVPIMCFGQESSIVHTIVRSAAPRFDLTSLSEVLKTAFKHWDEDGFATGGLREINVNGRWAPVDFYKYGYVRRNPAYKPFQILWSISSQINNHSTGCYVTVEPENGIRECCGFEYVHTFMSHRWRMQIVSIIEQYRDLPILACCLEDTSFVQPNQLEIREYRIIFSGSTPFNESKRWAYLRKLIDHLTYNKIVSSYNAYWID